MGCVSICRILLTQQTLVHCSSRHLTGRSPAIAWFRALSTQQAQNNNNPPLPGYLTSFSLCASYLKNDKDRPCDFSFIGEYGFNLPPQPTFPADRNSPRKFHQPPDVCYYDRYLEDLGWYLTSSLKGAYLGCFPPPDFVFYVDGRPIQAHKVILSARSPYFKHKFETDWKHLTYFIFSKDELSYKALDYLIYFFYSDWVDIALDNLQDFATISQIFRCESFSKIINKHLPCIYLSRHTHISFTGSLLPEEDRLPAALYRLLQSENVHDLADICVKVDQRIFRCHQVVLATRSKYFKNRIRHIYDSQQKDALPCLEEHDMNQVVFEKILEYMYTNDLKDIDPKQARELFDAALRYLLFPLHGVLVKILLPHVKMASSPAEICDWLLLADVYKVLRIRSYCLVTIARDFQTFADTREFRAMLLTLQSTAPSPFAVGGGNINQFNIVDELRERWLQVKCAELDQNNENDKALSFDKHLQKLMQLAEQEKNR